MKVEPNNKLTENQNKINLKKKNEALNQGKTNRTAMRVNSHPRVIGRVITHDTGVANEVIMLQIVLEKVWAV